jgi:5-(carboxyamino)imidazole ribonucleotide synthase
MLAESNRIKNLGLHITALDPNPNCPAAKFIDGFIQGGYLEKAKIKELAEATDILTYEIEFTDADYLAELAKEGYKIAPDPKSLKIIQDKLLQRQFFKKHGLPHPEFHSVSTLGELLKASEKFSFPFFLKARFGSYDGKGNYVVKSKDDFGPALQYFRGKDLLAEAFVNFTKEVSVIAARNESGEQTTYPVGENLHKESILFYTIVPARISAAEESKARELAQKVIDCLTGAGVFGIEMFITKNGEVLINEIAPRVHNTGHYTIEGAKTSQFEQHLRAIINQPLGDTSLLAASIMVNILGKGDFSGPYALRKEAAIIKDSSVSLHMYDKTEVSPKRKMGHLTKVFPNKKTISDEELLETLKLIDSIEFVPA